MLRMRKSVYYCLQMFMFNMIKCILMCFPFCCGHVCAFERENGSSFFWVWQPSLLQTASNPTNTDHHRDVIPLRNPTNPERPNTTSTGLSGTRIPATTSDTRKPVTAKTLRDPTTCTFPTAACRPSSTSWTATLATWPRSTTRARLVSPTPTSLLPSSLGNTGHDTSMTPTSQSKGFYFHQTSGYEGFSMKSYLCIYVQM
ncbi:uncharacterized protein LOC122261721 [Penaeus japonicus]|uniref:uncharacterized protein LOC122261721 n=1 Tax=Penaeus japonicus TaxID=27405 RepID=UPI001C71674E|nr:uncharacterized protein LOC122261721 [Penaeus japonicus]